MKTHRFLWEMIRYRPWLYTVNAILWTGIHLAPLLPGLIIQRFFNVFGVKTEPASTVWMLIALLVAVAIGRSVLFIVGIAVDQLHRFTMSAMLRRNILSAVLEQPGAAALGEMFRDPLEAARMGEVVVGMQMQDHVAAGGQDAGVHGVGDATRRVIDHAHVARHLRDHVERAVGRATIDEDVLEVAIGLGRHRGERVAEELSAVARAGDDGKA